MPSLRFRGELVLVGLLAALGVYVLVQTPAIVVPPSAATAGPRLFPYLVGGLLIVVAALLAVQVLRGRTAPPEDGEDVDPDRGTDWRAMFVVIALFAVHALLIEPIGWPLAATALFAGTAAVLGARRWVVVLVSSFALAIGLWSVFVFGLGAYLPGGPFQMWT
ncbi:tripartite tricarboxylate transporter TctB family protein [Allokutzneria oryzae]|uniref:Tripartite tricarboxylate transporter TctB family protein n=1 Tax=Allokutzneria oryzae TaxID=1378989 RepID=A0ABV6A6V5_9PSEU